MDGGSSLWTDGGTFTYLSSTTDDLVLGASTTTNAPFFFDVSEKRLGIGTGSPQATIDIAGASSTISNTSGDITITPADQLVILGDMELGNGSTTRSLYAYNASRTYYGQIELYNLVTGNMTLRSTFDTGDIVLNPGGDVVIDGGDINLSTVGSRIYGEDLEISGDNSSDIYLQLGGGNVGIGTISPDYTLQIEQSYGQYGVLQALSTYVSGYQAIWAEEIASANWGERFYYEALVYDSKMWILGGIDGSYNLLNDVWYSTNGANWAQATASAGWGGRYSHEAVVYDGKIWVLGGSNMGSFFNDVWYSTDGVNWTQATASASWPARFGHEVIVYNEKMWVIGGRNDSTVYNDVWYSTDGVNWTQATGSTSWLARFGHEAVVYDGKIWVLGGSTNMGSFFNDVWYSTDGVNWTQATDSVDWHARAFLSSMVFDEKIIILGGMGESSYYNDVWYSTDGVNWSEASDSAAWGYRFGHKSFVYNNKMWILGGGDADYNLHNDVWSGELSPIDSIRGLTVDKTGKVGIGMTNPTAELSVFGSITGGSEAYSAGYNNFTFGYDDDLLNTLNTSKDGLDGDISSIMTQDNGKILIVGSFTNYGQVDRQRIMRLNVDGSLDGSFDTSVAANDEISAISIQDDGKILIGGWFTSYGGSVAKGIARLNADGTLDTTFNSDLEIGSPVNSIEIQEDGKILIGGYFTTYGGVTRQYIARLNSDGSLDTTFDSSSGADGVVYAIAIQDDGKILIGGWFTSYGGVTRQRIARLNSDGSLDTTFDSSSGANYNYVTTIAIQDDNKILIGGDFTTYGGVTRQRIARLNSDGSLDITFDSSSGADSSVESIEIQEDGKILIGGYFTTYGGVTRQRIARLNSDGSLDTSFDSSSGASSGVRAIEVQDNDKILIGGDFISYAGIIRQKIAQLDTDGNLDDSFVSRSQIMNGVVYSTVIQNDGKILVGGQFTVYGGETRQRIVRLNSDGSLDTTFDSSSGANGVVYAIAIQDDGKILIGGDFTEYKGIARQRIARLNSDGSLDTTFDSSSGADGVVYAIAIQDDGKIVVGGWFYKYGGVTRQGIARLNTNGSLDTTFDSSSGTNSLVETVAIQSDGKILIGGCFTSYGGVARKYLARVNSDGSLDMGFDTSNGPDDYVLILTIQSDGKILIGGQFDFYGSVSRGRVARINNDGSLDTTFDSSSGITGNLVHAIAIQDDGKILIGGTFYSYAGVSRKKIARLNNDGSIDASFDSSNGANETVYSIAIQDDGNIIIGGEFTSYGSENIYYLGRLSSTGSVTSMGLVNDINDSFIVNFDTSRLAIDSSGLNISNLLTLTGDLWSGENNTYNIGDSGNRWRNVYAQGSINLGADGDNGSIRYNTTTNELEFSNDGSTWIPLADAIKTTTISAEYPGAVLVADGTANVGSMTSDAEGSTSNSMNYYEWNSSESTLQDYDVRLRFTIPHDFSSWGTNAFTLNFATEVAASTNNKVDIYVYEESSGTVDDSSTDQYSSSAGVWQTTSLQGADLGDCNSTGETCVIILRMYSANDNYVRVGDIDVNYNRKL
jgi:uncharacterized delta-60 repeat protein